ncbi:MAG: hypothetical protein WAZ27_02925 [Minisyncoccia bacterium]
MKRRTHNLLALTLLIVSSTQLVFAESATDGVAVMEAKLIADAQALAAEESDAADSESRPSDDTPLIEAPGTEQQTVSASLVQDTFNAQEAVSGSMLENTSNPEDAAETESPRDVVPLVDETTPVQESSPLDTSSASSSDQMTVIPGPASLEVVTESLEETVLEETEILEEEIVPEEIPMVIEEEQLSEDLEVVTMTEPPPPPEPDFEFELTGKQIATKRAVLPRRPFDAEPDALVVDNDKGIMNISGACSDVYYVILLFKNVTDYEKDPGSYVVNKAYLCIGGEYSYSLAQLPASLKDGTYYLLVGQQGESGLWKPITDLTEVVINNNH